MTEMTLKKAAMLLVDLSKFHAYLAETAGSQPGMIAEIAQSSHKALSEDCANAARLVSQVTLTNPEEREKYQG